MALTTPNMGLKVWDSPSDPFSHSELQDNWDAVDIHNHTSGKGVQIPSGGIAVGAIGTTHLVDGSVTTIKINDGAVTAPKIGTAAFGTDNIQDDSLTAAKLKTNSITTVKITDANVTDAKLASPHNPVYHQLSRIQGLFGTKVVGTYFVDTAGAATITGGATTAAVPSGIFGFTAADYTVANKTQKLRVLQQVAVGATAPSTVTLNCGLYPLTLSAGNWTIGTLVPGSATTTTGLATNTITRIAGTDFTIPSDGVYCLGVVVGSITCPTGIDVSAQLQSHSV